MKKISVSDVLNAALRKIANGTVDPREFVSSDLQNTQYQVAFEDLKKEILVGHQEIAQGKVTSVADVRKEFGLDYVENVIRSFFQIVLSRTCVTFTTIFL